MVTREHIVTNICSIAWCNGVQDTVYCLNGCCMCVATLSLNLRQAGVQFSGWTPLCHTGSWRQCARDNAAGLLLAPPADVTLYNPRLSIICILMP